MGALQIIYPNTATFFLKTSLENYWEQGKYALEETIFCGQRSTWHFKG